MIGDKDLLDVWDDLDPVPVRLLVLARVFDELDGRPDDRRRREAVRLLAKLAAQLAG